MTATPTVIPPGTRVDGRIECAGDLVVEGRCAGELVVRGTLTVARGAVCEAGARAEVALIHGEVIGNVIATERLEVYAGARVVGDLRAPDVEIDATGSVDGTVDMLPPEPETISVARDVASVRGAQLLRPVAPARGGLP